MHFFYNEWDDGRVFEEDQTNVYQYRLYGDLVVQIRKDLGHVKWFESESWLDVVRLKIKDIDDYIPNKNRGQRLTHTMPGMLINGKIRK